MTEYSKVFKKDENQDYFFRLNHFANFDSVDTPNSYLYVMKENYDDGYSQVIINTSIMLSIIKNALKERWVLNSINIDSPVVDEDIDKELKNYVKLIKRDVMYFDDLKDYLYWTLDEGSIFIDSIVLIKKVDEKIISSEVYSNGLISGEDSDVVYQEVIDKTLKEYLNGR